MFGLNLPFGHQPSQGLSSNLQSKQQITLANLRSTVTKPFLRVLPSPVSLTLQLTTFVALTYTLGTVHWSISRPADDQARPRTGHKEAKDRQFRAYNLPTG